MPTYNPNVFPDMGNCYVEDMNFHASLDPTGEVNFLIPDAVADATVLIALAAYLAAETKAQKLDIKEPFGRTLLVNHSVATTVIVKGYDYLGQPMSETITIATGGTAVEGNKAFKRVSSITATLAGNVTVSAGNRYGLPFVAVELIREIVDGLTAAEGAITVPPTTAQTATSVDPRGLYNPAQNADGLKDISVTYVTAPEQVGGLYGRRHFAA